MEKTNQYSSIIKSRPLFYIETKRLAKLVIQGLNEIELKEQVINQNIFQVNTEQRKRDIASAILNRFNAIDDHLIKNIYISDIETSKIIVLYAILKTDLLFYEFMEEVFSEKLFYQDSTISDKDFNQFFEVKRQQSERVSSWKDYTLRKIKQVYIRILHEAGLIKNHRKQREIIIPIINQDILKYMRQTDDPKYINAIVGG